MQRIPTETGGSRNALRRCHRADPLAAQELVFLQVYGLAFKIAQFHAAGMVTSLGLPPADREDIEQELLLGLWLDLRRFDIARSSLQVFASRVLRNKLITIFRTYIAQRRGFRLCRNSLGDLAGTEGAQLAYSHDALSLKVDVARALASLPPELEATARLLCMQRVGEAARSLRVSRPALHRRIAKLRLAFVEHALDQYWFGAPTRTESPRATISFAGLRTSWRPSAHIDDRGSVRQASAKRTLRKTPSKSNTDVPASVLADCEVLPAAPSTRTKEAAHAARGC